MMRQLILLAVSLLCVGIASADEVKLPSPAPAVNQWAVGGVYKPDCPMPKDMQERRIFDPAKMSIDPAKATMLAKRLFVSQLVGCSSPVWTPMPYPGVVIQTYSMKPIGDAFVKVDRAHGVWRPGRTWWADAEMSMGVHLEQCEAGNLVFSLFVSQKTAVEYRYVTTTTEGPERMVVQRIIEPIYIGEPVAARQFIPPNVGTWSWAPASPIGVAVTTPGQWFNWLSFAVYQVSGVKLPGTPSSPYCLPGTAPPAAPPGNTTPPSTPPPTGNGAGWGGQYQPPPATPPGGSNAGDGTVPTPVPAPPPAS